MTMRDGWHGYTITVLIPSSYCVTLGCHIAQKNQFLPAASQLYPVTWGREVILTSVLIFGVDEKDTILAWAYSCPLPDLVEKRAVSVKKGRLIAQKKLKFSTGCGEERTKRREHT